MRDDLESVDLFEPLMVSDGARSRFKLNDLALTLAEKSAAFSASQPPAIANSLAEVVRTSSCYYSNLIEGHDIDPVDIERALHDDYSDDAKKRDLQLEARAHITVQKWIDDVGVDMAPFSTKFICDIHRRFCELLPPKLLLLEADRIGEQMSVVPGAIRTAKVQLGGHEAVSAGAVPRFLARMEQAYNSLGRIDRILSAACGHHRLLWVHPFLDANGRVARLVSHAVLRSSLRTGGLWSVARGLARREKEYKTHLQATEDSIPRYGRVALCAVSTVSTRLSILSRSAVFTTQIYYKIS